MSQKRAEDLKTTINSELATNLSGDISATDIRHNLVDIVDSVIDIMASGNDVYFMGPSGIDFRRDIGIASSEINSIYGHWGTGTNNYVSAVKFLTGSDTTSKSDGQLAFYTSYAGTLSQQMLIDPTGKVGIGTSTPAYSLEVSNNPGHSGYATIAVTNPHDMDYVNNSGHSIGSQIVFRGVKDADTLGGPQNIFSVGTDVQAMTPTSTETALPKNNLFIRDEYTAGTPVRFFISDGGHIGVGTTTPRGLLEISHSSQAPSGLYLNNTTGRGYGLFSLGASPSIGSSGNFVLYDYISNAIRLSVNPDGNVGINNSNPNAVLSIGDDLGTLVGSGVLEKAISFGSSDSVRVGIGVSSTKNAQFWWDNNQSSLRIESTNTNTNFNQLVLDSTNGNVGVGTSGAFIQPTGVGKLPYWSPSFNLHVADSGSIVNFGVENVRNASAAFRIGHNTLASGNLDHGQWASIGYDDTSDVLKINNSGTLTHNQLTIDVLGNVGIGTDAPYNGSSMGTNKLHIYGSDAGLLVGDIFGATDTPIRILGSRSTTDSSYIQLGANAADTGAKLRINRFDTDDVNIAQCSIYSDLTDAYGEVRLVGSGTGYAGFKCAYPVANNTTYTLPSGDGIASQALTTDGSRNISWANVTIPSGLGVTGHSIPKFHPTTTTILESSDMYEKEGRVGIGDPVPSYQLELSTNSAGKPGSSLWTVTSDETIKTDVSDIVGGLDKINALRPVKFKFIDDYRTKHSLEDKYYCNFIAQEVESVMPECVSEHGGLKGVDSHDIFINLVAAVKELKERVEFLENQ